MEEFRKWFEIKKKELRSKTPDEIDCGMGWKAGLEWAMTLANMGGEIALDELEKEVT